MGFLKTILIILLVYYLLKILARWFAPKIFSYAAKKTEKHFRDTFEAFQNQVNEQQGDNGEISLDKRMSKNKNPSDNVGEYIEFEELD